MWKLYRADLLGKDLETSLRQIITDARNNRHKILSVEHLLLSMLDNVSAVETLQAHGIKDIEELRKLLVDHINQNTPLVPESSGSDEQPAVAAKPTLAFHRVIQSAILQVKSTGQKGVQGNLVLSYLLREYDTYAVSLLNQRALYSLEDLMEKKAEKSAGSDIYTNEGTTDPHDPHRVAKNESLLAAGLMPMVSIDETGENLGFYSPDLGADTLAALAKAAR
ncbi:Clp protease N-terminal domain-containing protein [Candidatus Nitrotoga fabula]|uniref:ATP-dependent Clp protease, ATP-binding subunit clpA n=1 Tax=Candidatus Nitrotoga fabula TaxID=2182327 RepID=A0A916BAY4_9PROT|nr:Clp protease N-terminal domain-containing protein [Candidatus Nitrotoga fabula]CAE6688170.1 ATP-dependent Clp protease, ATP-binding subunit clpA [Candidatus Nitrotoga fabula]